MKRLFSGLVNQYIGIDLGTSNTVVFVKNKGIVLNEASVIVLDENNKVLAVGNDAKNMIGRTPLKIRAIRPLREGVIADFEVTQKMIQYFIKKALASTMFAGPRVVVGVPYQITEVEKRAVYDATIQAGAKDVYLIEEPMAAAIGAGLPVTDAFGSMVVDIGGGTTEIAIISLGGIVSARSIRIGGDEFDSAILGYIKKKFNIIVGDNTAERIKMEIGNAIVPKNEKMIEITGRNLVTGIPNKVILKSSDVNIALEDPIRKIIDGVKATLEAAPPELASDVFVSGIMLTGGGALIHGLGQLISNETGIPVRIAENPLDCVVRGAAEVVERFDELRGVFSTVRGK
ncbi:MAG: rod shape-determining protein [Bacillota bacterium]|nr:rod shape-determining protein [Bacillota bacterium]